MKIIAESAFNHQGNLDYLLKMASAAKLAGADLFTVQIYNTEKFCVKEYSKYKICLDTQLTPANWDQLFAHCRTIELNLIPCILDDDALEIIKPYNFPIVKIHATDLLNEPFLKKISQLNYKILLETQCATIKDIELALGWVGDKIEAIFHGFSNYPTELDDMNLDALDFLRSKFNKPVGFADHSLDSLGIPVMLLAKKVDYLEKHITLSRNDRHFDWQVSLEPDEFTIMVSNIRKYTKALGSGYKHPVKNELPYRTIMYKKFVTGSNGELSIIRSDNGQTYYEWNYDSFDKNRVVGAIIARLKSQRFKQKVLKPLHNDMLIFDLIERVKTSAFLGNVILASSYLEEDKPLLDEAKKRNIPTYGGDPLSVIERLISVAEQEKAYGVFRITGDNPLTDPTIIDRMISLFRENQLDYVRTNNLPFGITAELFSVKYLTSLMIEMDDPRQSEYLTWFVLKDTKGKKGALDFKSDHRELFKVNYSVDYEADYNRVKSLLSRIGKIDFKAITLKEIIEKSDFNELLDLNSEIKLPGGVKMKYIDFISALKSMNYFVREEISLDKI
ncbi:MAG: N-acetylneuraminate synthase family protein [Bacteroidetes bacterium]|nr:N-acetylneuraminate synthase family protein [Bacteroidota bacterium]